MEMLVAFPATTVSHNLLKRLFDEQYIVEDGKAVLLDKNEIKADSIQNPNDPDATCREKERPEGARLCDQYHRNRGARKAQHHHFRSGGNCSICRLSFPSGSCRKQ